MPGHKDWLKKSYGELKAAKLLIQDKEILDIAAFHTHQCAEKALKGYLMFKHMQIPKTHSLEELLMICFKANQAFIELLHDVIMIDPYVINTRYPDDHFSIGEKEILKAIDHAERIFKFVEAHTSKQKVMIDVT